MVLNWVSLLWLWLLTLFISGLNRQQQDAVPQLPQLDSFSPNSMHTQTADVYYPCSII